MAAQKVPARPAARSLPNRVGSYKYYGQLIGEVEPIQGARRLLADLQAAGRTTVLASSARRDELAHYLNLLAARHLVATWTDDSDVEATKPQPDIVRAALSKAGKTSGVMVGDSVFDCEAARRAGLGSIAVLTGGFSRAELEEAGASRVCGSMEELRDALELSAVPSSCLPCPRAPPPTEASRRGRSPPVLHLGPIRSRLRSQSRFRACPR